MSLTLHRRKGSPYWWVRGTVKGQRVRESTKTRVRSLAERYAKEKYDRLWMSAHLDKGHTIDDAVERWLDEKKHKRSLWVDKQRLGWFKGEMDGVLLEDVGGRVAGLRAKLESTLGATTVDHYMRQLASLMKAAVRWGWIEKAPHVPMARREAPEVGRLLTMDEETRLLVELPPWTADMARFALATGLRKSNITHLRWEQVDLRTNRLTVMGAQSKNKRTFSIPLNGEAVAVLNRRAGVLGLKHPEYVFWCHDIQGRVVAPIKTVCTKAWRKATVRAGVKGLRFHDLRHTWTTRKILAGTPEHVVQALGAWKTRAIVARYTHLQVDELAKWA